MGTNAADLEKSIDTPTNYIGKSGVKLEDDADNEQLNRSDPPIMEPAPGNGSHSRTGSPVDASLYDKMSVCTATAQFSSAEISVDRGTLANMIRALSYSYKSSEALRMMYGLIIEGFHLQGIRQIKPGFAKTINPDMLKTVYADLGKTASVRSPALMTELTMARKDGKLLDVIYEHILTTYLELLQQISCFKNAKEDILSTLSKTINIDINKPTEEIVEEVIRLKGLPDYTDGKFSVPEASAAPMVVSAMDIVRRSDDLTGLRQENEMLRATIDSLKREIAESSNAVALMRTETSTGTIEIEKLRAEIERLCEQNKRLKQIADEAKTETAATRTSNAALRHQLETLKQNNAAETANAVKSERGPSRPRSRSVRDASESLTTADLSHTIARTNEPPSHAAARQHRPSRPTSAAQQRIISGKVAPARIEINNSSYYAIHGKDGEVNNTGVPAVLARVVRRNATTVDNCLVCIGPPNPVMSTRAKSPEKPSQEAKPASPNVRRIAVTPNRKAGTVAMGQSLKATPKRPASSRPATSSIKTPNARSQMLESCTTSQLTYSRGPAKLTSSTLPPDMTSRVSRSRTPADDLYKQIDRLSVELATEKEKRYAVLEENRNLKATLTNMERQTRQQMNNIESKYRAVLEHTVKKLSNRG